MSESEKPKRRRRTNAEILADQIREREERAARKKATAAKKPAPGVKKVRRTKAQMEADRRAEAEARELLAKERAALIPAPKVPKFKRTIYFLEDGITALGNVWEAGDVVTIEEGSPYYEDAFRDDGSFVFDLSEEQQIQRWGHVKYRDESMAAVIATSGETTHYTPTDTSSTVSVQSFGSGSGTYHVPVGEDGMRKNPVFSTTNIDHPDEDYAHLYDEDYDPPIEE